LHSGIAARIGKAGHGQPFRQVFGLVPMVKLSLSLVCDVIANE
jgi:hypothetical protein